MHHLFYINLFYKQQAECLKYIMIVIHKHIIFFIMAENGEHIQKLSLVW